MDILETILAVCLVALPIICVAVVPSFLKNWKRLILWHLIFSILANSLLLWSEFDLALHGGNPAGAGGVAILVLILVTFHLIACASMGLKIYDYKGNGIVKFLFHASIAALAYILIIIGVYLIGRFGLALFYGLDFSSLRRK